MPAVALAIVRAVVDTAYDILSLVAIGLVMHVGAVVYEYPKVIVHTVEPVPTVTTPRLSFAFEDKEEPIPQELSVGAELASKSKCPLPRSPSNEPDSAVFEDTNTTFPDGDADECISRLPCGVPVDNPTLPEAVNVRPKFPLAIRGPMDKG